MTGPVVIPDEALDAMTDAERAGWLAFARALRSQVERGTHRYAAVPHHLLRAMHLPAYPLDALTADVCGMAGYLRDPVAEVDWLCLLPAGHHGDLDHPAGSPHGWARHGPRPGHMPAVVIVRDAVNVEGIRPELDEVGAELVWLFDLAAAGDLDGLDLTVECPPLDMAP